MELPHIENHLNCDHFDAFRLTNAPKIGKIPTISLNLTRASFKCKSSSFFMINSKISMYRSRFTDFDIYTWHLQGTANFNNFQSDEHQNLQPDQKLHYVGITCHVKVKEIPVVIAVQKLCSARSFVIDIQVDFTFLTMIYLLSLSV